ncbi:hypothetical protein Tco_1349534 [Tanacetum coccineum]
MSVSQPIMVHQPLDSEISKEYQEVTEEIDVKNWRVRSGTAKSLQFEHSAFSRLSADPEALIEELGGVEGPREEHGGVEGLGDKHRESRSSTFRYQVYKRTYIDQLIGSADYFVSSIKE